MHIGEVLQRTQIATSNIPSAARCKPPLRAEWSGLNLLKTVPPPVPTATGDMTGTVKLLLPLKPIVPPAEMRLNVATVLGNVTLPLRYRD